VFPVLFMLFSARAAFLIVPSSDWPLRVALFFLFSTVAILPLAKVHAAGGAFIVDDSEIGKPGDCKVESWAQAASNHNFAAVAAPACVVNLGLPVEAGATLNRSRVDSEWQTSAGPKAKINIVPAETGKLGIGLAGALNWNTANGQYLGNLVYVPVTYQATDAFKINLNAGWQYDGSARLSYAYWGAGFEWNFVKPVTLIGEVFGYYGKLPASGEDEPPTAGSIREPRTQIGLRFTPQSNFDVDVIYGHNITGENAHWMTLGLNLRF
jgi:hypothetical protein